MPRNQRNHGTRFFSRLLSNPGKRGNPVNPKVWGAGRQLPNAQWMPESEEVMDENCRRIEKLLDLYRDGKLTDVQKADVEYHLLVCPECIFLLTLVPSLSPE